MRNQGRSKHNSKRELLVGLPRGLTSEEKWAVVTECKTRIGCLEQTIKELKEELKNHKKEDVETQRYITNRRLAIYLAVASILSGILGKFFDLVIAYLKP